MTVTEQVARFVVDTDLNDIPERTVQYAKELALSNAADTRPRCPMPPWPMATLPTHRNGKVTADPRWSAL